MAMMTALYRNIIALILVTISPLLVIAYSEHETQSDLHLIVALPLEDYDSETSTTWERGRDILSGAEAAVETINRREDIFPEQSLYIVTVNIGRCGNQNYNLLLHFINITNHRDMHLIGAVGIFCPTAMQVIFQPPCDDSTTIALTKTNLKSLVDATGYSYSQKLGMSVSDRMTESLLEFFSVLGWKKIAAITNPDDTFFSYFVEKLYKASIQHRSNFTIGVHNYDTNIDVNLPRIVLVSVSLPLATELLCSAYRGDKMWPNHVWILHTYHFETIVNVNASCNIELALENVLVFSEMLPLFWGDNISYNTTTSPYSNIIVERNVYSHILHDLVWSVALAVNETYERQSGQTNDLDTFPQRKIVIIQVRNSTKIQIATYSDHQLIFTDTTFTMTAPSDELLTVTEGASMAYTALFITEIVSMFVFVTVMLIGYSCFRKEPEVKSTSFSLSLLVFLGCYLVLVYLSILLYFHQPWPTSEETLNGLCISLNWFSGLGISSALILATALVKILRIYHIFNKSSAKRLSKRCSDSYLAVYVVLLISPLLFVHTLWTIVDPYLGYLEVSVQLNIIQIQKQCTSNYSLLWYAMLIVYMSIIFVILLIVAIKMRKIQKSHFKDTKKIIILVVCYFTDIIVAITIWRVLYTTVNAYYAAIVLHIGHITTLVICQVLLFAPKVLPPLARHCLKTKSSQDVRTKSIGTQDTTF